jgi:hypothetical protein
LSAGFHRIVHRARPDPRDRRGKAKTDKVDTRIQAKLLAAEFLPPA